MAETLVDLARVDRNAEVAVTKQDLAAFAGTSREEVTRTLGEPRRAALIESEAYCRIIRIPDPARLIAAVEKN